MTLTEMKDTIKWIKTQMNANDTSSKNGSMPSSCSAELNFRCAADDHNHNVITAQHVKTKKDEITGSVRCNVLSFLGVPQCWVSKDCQASEHWRLRFHSASTLINPRWWMRCMQWLLSVDDHAHFLNLHLQFYTINWHDKHITTDQWVHLFFFCCAFLMKDCLLVLAKQKNAELYSSNKSTQIARTVCNLPTNAPRTTHRCSNLRCAMKPHPTTW